MKAGSPSDDDLEELAYMLYDNWERLGRRLGFDQATMTVLDKENAKVSEKALRMLIHWRLRMGSHGTYQVLYDALCHKLVNCKRIAQEICLSQEGNKLLLKTRNITKDGETSYPSCLIILVL